MLQRLLWIGALIFCVVWVFLIFTFNGHWDEAISSDALAYSGAAEHLVTQGFYSLDGTTPYMEREPGYSFFLGAIYAVFGRANVFAIFAAQGLLYLGACALFCLRVLRPMSERVAGICFVLLLSLPEAIRAVFSVYRESFVLSLFLLFTVAFFLLLRKKSWQWSMIAGGLLGLIAFTYFPFVFLPLFLGIFLSVSHIRLRHVVLFLIASYCFVGAWGLRNAAYDGRFHVVGSFRSTVNWYFRGEQAEKVQGFEPFLCLWSEYISRDWSGRSSACSVTGVFHTKWPGGVPMGTEAQINAEAKTKISQHMISYLWNSLFEAVELHFPLVGGWHFPYNILAAIGSSFLYFGTLIYALFAKSRKSDIFFILVIAYTTAVFALTDGTPRYLVPVVFCYAVFAAMGYDWLLSRLWQR